jgi:hypothetical protein
MRSERIRRERDTTTAVNHQRGTPLDRARELVSLTLRSQPRMHLLTAPWKPAR